VNRQEVIPTGNQISAELGIEFPILAFSHCRDVVAAVSRAGGMGVLGSVRISPEQLETELKWIDEHIDGKPYGVDMLFASSYAGDDEDALRRQIPKESIDFVKSLTERFHIPPPKDPDAPSVRGDAAIITHARGRALLDVAFSHPIKLFVSALGPPPPDLVNRAHAHGTKVAGMVGSVAHARKQVAANVDIVIAVGTEAAGHTGEVSTMVLVPQIVDAVSPTPVLAAGGIASGRQMAAAIALGAAGVWTGSVWLTTTESDIEPIVMQKLLNARSEDTVRSRCYSGKPIRQLRTKWTDAWEERDAPPILPMPLQGLLIRDAIAGAYDYNVEEVVGGAVGQVVGMMHGVRPVRDVVYDMVREYTDVLARLSDLS
jgi:NAD(P)H-dependent flavin oxidoreductase YrpB (nitropropane dioxygenase family)